MIVFYYYLGVRENIQEKANTKDGGSNVRF